MSFPSLKRPLSVECEPEPEVEMRPSKKMRVAPLTTVVMNNLMETFNTPPKKVSPFPDVVSSKCTPEYMAASIDSEIKKLKRSKRLILGQYIENQPPSNMPLLTYEQVTQVCQNLMREREAEIREQYNKVLTDKLTEQYDSFVRFVYDQLQKGGNSEVDYYS